ncbi:MAG: hypothetical protein DRQ46_10095 [Gammaproteobacteria bacterium]|nr:MAG: hypothetical protein DRQ46_10095 [Gammaproteobacteria bacterium]
MLTLKTQLLLILALFLTLPAVAEDASTSSNPEKYINITFEIYGLDESANLLKNASLDLAKKLSQLDPDPDEMTPEQLQALSSVIQEANRLIQSVDKSISQTGLEFENLVSDSLIAVNQSTIEPTIQSVDNSITKWLIISFLGIFLLVVAVGYYFYIASKQIRSMASTLKSITEDYEIVPKHIKE